MKVIFNETQYEFKTFYSETNGYELHLFKDDKIINITPLHVIPSPSAMFNIYAGKLKKYVKFDSVKVHFK